MTSGVYERRAAYLRVLDRTVKTDTCWLWPGNLTGDGYGRLKDNGKEVRAHRVVYEALVGSIPEGMHLHHLCRTRNCVNPEHLEPVTNQENTRRAVEQRDQAILLRSCLERALGFLERSWDSDQVDREEYYAARDDIRNVLADVSPQPPKDTR